MSKDSFWPSDSEVIPAASSAVASLPTAHVDPLNQPSSQLRARDCEWNLPLLSLPGRAGLERRPLRVRLGDEGLAREFVHRVQTMRKNAGFDIADYITTTYAAGGRLAAALQRHADYAAAETLSRELRVVPTPQDAAGYTETFTVDGDEATVGVERVG